MGALLAVELASNDAAKGCSLSVRDQIIGTERLSHARGYLSPALQPELAMESAPAEIAIKQLL